MGVDPPRRLAVVISKPLFLNAPKGCANSSYHKPVGCCGSISECPVTIISIFAITHLQPHHPPNGMRLFRGRLLGLRRLEVLPGSLRYGLPHVRHQVVEHPDVVKREQLRSEHFLRTEEMREVGARERRARVTPAG